MGTSACDCSPQTTTQISQNLADQRKLAEEIGRRRLGTRRTRSGRKEGDQQQEQGDRKPHECTPLEIHEAELSRAFPF